MNRGGPLIVGGVAVLLAVGTFIALSGGDGDARVDPVTGADPEGARDGEVRATSSTTGDPSDDPRAPRPDPSVLDGLDLDAYRSDGPPPPTAEAQAREARLQEPDAVWYGGTASAWRAIQRALHRAHADPALVEDVAALVEQLRAARRAPDRVQLDTLKQVEHDMRERLAQAGHGVDLSPLTSALARHDARLAASNSR